MLQDQPAYRLEHLIAEQMTVAVIQALEVIHVEQHHCQALAVARGLRDAMVALVVEDGARAEPGQRIGAGQQ